MESNKKTEKKKGKKPLKKILIILAVILLLVFISGVIIIISSKDEQQTQKFNSIRNSVTIEGERLVFKSTAEYNKIIEYIFESNIPKSIKIYEQFETDEEFEKGKETYLKNSNIEVLNINENEKSIEIQKKDFGSDRELSYDQVYDKYLMQIIGAYEQI